MIGRRGWRRALLAALCVSLVVSAAGRAQAQGGPPRVEITDARADQETAEIQVLVTVIGPDGRAVKGLSRASFEVVDKPDDGEAAAVDAFTVGIEDEVRGAGDGTTPPPLTLGLAIDTSDSMSGKPIAEARAAAAEFVDSRPDGDEIALFAFSTEVRKVQDFTTDKAAIKAAIAGLEADGDTALYEAIHQVSGAVKDRRATRGRDGRGAFVVLTDGQNDSALARRQDEAIASAVNAGVPAYMLGFGSTLDEVLGKVADRSGGLYLERPDAAGIRGLLGDLIDVLNPYVLTYRLDPLPGVMPHRVAVTARTDGGEGSDVAFVVVIGPTPTPTATPGPTPTPTDCPPGDPDCGGPAIDPLAAALGLAGLLIAGLLVGLVLVLRRGRGQAPPPGPNPPGPQLPGPPPPGPLYSGPAYGPGPTPTLPVDPGPPPPPPPPPAVPGPAPTRPLPASPPTQVIQPPGSTATLVVESGPQAGMRFHLGPGTTQIGRETDNQIVITDPTVSRKHALVRARDGQFRIYTLSTRNPLLVNGQPVHEQVLQDGDELGLGQTVLRFRISGAGP